MTEQDFMNNVLGNAQRLCNPKMNEAMDRMHPKASMNPNRDIDPSAFDDEADKWDAMFLGEAAMSSTRQTQQPMQQMPTGKNKTRMPSFIKESMETNPIDTRALSDNPLDRMDLSGLMRETSQIQSPAPAPVQAQVAIPTGIDYSIIRAIINECLDTKLAELKKQPINENAVLKTIGLKEGKIRIVDNKGNIFAAKLEKEGNINDK